MEKNNIEYIITTGWWCTNDELIDDREAKYGDSRIRTDSFHHDWFNAVNTFTKPKSIYIIDSNSPVKPMMNKESEVLISLLNNAGHSTQHIGKLSGVSRAHLLGMSLAMVNEVEYWVYIEQDALIYGQDIIENSIKNMKKQYMFGSGEGTPQPLQQSFMIIRQEAIPSFIKNFTSIKAKDKDISPELKFAIATSFILRMIPEFIYIKMHKQGRLNYILNVVMKKIISIFKGYDELPFGYGRKRPINFTDEHFYFQHSDAEEMKIFFKKFKNESIEQ